MFLQTSGPVFPGFFILCLVQYSPAFVFGSSISVAEARLTIVKPIPETVEAVLDKVFCCSEIEPRVDLIILADVYMVDG